MGRARGLCIVCLYIFSWKFLNSVDFRWIIEEQRSLSYYMLETRIRNWQNWLLSMCRQLWDSADCWVIVHNCTGFRLAVGVIFRLRQTEISGPKTLFSVCLRRKITSTGFSGSWAPQPIFWLVLSMCAVKLHLAGTRRYIPWKFTWPVKLPSSWLTSTLLFYHCYMHGDILRAHARWITQCITLYSVSVRNARTVNNAVWNVIYRAQRIR